MLYLLAFLAGCSGISEETIDLLSPDYDRISEEEVDSLMVAAASSIGDEYFRRCERGEFEPFGNEATTRMRQALTPERQEEAWEEISGIYGDYESIRFDSVWEPIDGTKLTIYRFRARFTDVKPDPELRIILDGNGKLSGLWVKPWRPMLVR